MLFNLGIKATLNITEVQHKLCKHINTLVLLNLTPEMFVNVKCNECCYKRFKQQHNINASGLLNLMTRMFVNNSFGDLTVYYTL